MEKYYVVINMNDITQEMLDESVHTCDHFRKSLNCDCAILKFKSKYPNTMGGYKKHTLEEIHQFISDNAIDWINNEV